jgi:hypothetical protein
MDRKWPPPCMQCYCNVGRAVSVMRELHGRNKAVDNSVSDQLQGQIGCGVRQGPAVAMVTGPAWINFLEALREA